MFLGFKPGINGYKLWCLEDKKVIYSRDVVFDEAAMWKRPSNDQEDMSCQPSQDSQVGTSHVDVDFPPLISTSSKHNVIDENDYEANPLAHFYCI